MLRLTAPGLYAEFYGLPWAETDPAAFVPAFVERYRAGVGDLVVVQEWEDCRCSMGHPMIVEFTAADGTRTTEVLTGFPIEEGTSVYVFVSGRIGDRLGGHAPEELRRLDRLVRLDMPLVFGTGPSSEPAPACEPAVLYPGYPGYRGNVPGAWGAGDSACLADLEAVSPAFSGEREDAANRQAARRLGVTGDIADWTWETWMAIEVERGFVPACYACIYTQGIAPGSGAPAAVASDDPRLTLGIFGGREIALRFFRERGLDVSMAYNAPTDDQLRAIAGMANPGRYLKPTEILYVADEILAGWYAIDRPGAAPNVGLLWDNLIAQGGYAPTPAAATEGDQFFMILEGAHALSINLVPFAQTYLMNRVNEAFQEWKFAPATRPSFAQWLRDAGAADWA
jgi:hypothetical protein